MIILALTTAAFLVFSLLRIYMLLVECRNAKYTIIGSKQYTTILVLPKHKHHGAAASRLAPKVSIHFYRVAGRMAKHLRLTAPVVAPQ